MKEPVADLANRICCPECHHLFEASDDLLGSKVQCGVCDHVFTVEEDHISHGKERGFYPGEKESKIPFHNLRNDEISDAPVVKSASNASFKHPFLSNMTPTHYLAAGVAIVLFLTGIGLLGVTSMFDGVRTMAPLVVGGLLGLTTALLWIYSQIDRRVSGSFVGLLAGLAVFSMPWVRKAVIPEVSKGESVAPIVTPELAAANKQAAEKKKIDREFEKIGSHVMDQLRSEPRYAKQPIIGIFIRNLGEANRLLMSEYLLRETGASPNSLSYPREKGILFVLINPKMSFAEIQKMITLVAENQVLTNVWPNEFILDLVSNNQLYAEVAQDQLTNRESEKFYQMNRNELDSIDLGRVMNAIDRLADVSPREFRVDVTRIAVRLLNSCQDVRDCDRLCRLLQTWSPTESGEASKVAAVAANRLNREGKPPGRDTVMFLGSRQEKEALPLIISLWKKDLTHWEEAVRSFGSSAEPVLLETLTSPKSVAELFATVRVLGRIGGRDSLLALEKLSVTQNISLKQELDIAIPSIRERLAGR